MKHIATLIQDGATAFLWAEYKYMFVYIVLFGAFLLWFTGLPCMISFVVGAITSILAGWIGMKIAVFTNVRTTHQCWKSLSLGYDVAIQGGSVMGLSLVAIGVLDLFALIKCFDKNEWEEKKDMYECIAGYGLGGSSIALFVRVGGGIYTKAADVGADLSGKNEYGLEEDDYRNPACIADNVGDNVGDIAGMGADLFGSFAESTCAALVLAATSEDLNVYWCSLMYPVMISSLGIFFGFVTLIITPCIFKVETPESVEKALKGILIVSTVLMTPVTIVLSYISLPDEFQVDEDHMKVTPMDCCIPVLLGLWSGLIIGFITEYYTSH